MRQAIEWRLWIWQWLLKHDRLDKNYQIKYPSGHFIDVNPFISAYQEIVTAITTSKDAEGEKGSEGASILDVERHFHSKGHSLQKAWEACRAAVWKITDEYTKANPDCLRHRLPENHKPNPDAPIDSILYEKKNHSKNKLISLSRWNEQRKAPN